MAAKKKKFQNGCRGLACEGGEKAIEREHMGMWDVLAAMRETFRQRDRQR